MKPTQVDLWTVILAGGDGKRLLPLTSRLAGDTRPKQFCAILGGETLLECTRRLLRGGGVFRVRGFWEKPSPAMARWLLARGGLWNSFVIVGWVSRLLDLVEATAPELLAALEPVRRALGSSREAAAAEAVYAELPSINFSRSVLARAPDRFVTMPVSGLEWSDLGDPRRVVATLRRTEQPVPWFGEATASWRTEGSA